MIKLIYIFLTLLVLTSCEKDIIESKKTINIHVKNDDNEPIDSVQFAIIKTVPVVSKLVAEEFTDNQGNCILIFDYNTENFASYDLQTNGVTEGYTTSGVYNPRIYKLKGNLPYLDFNKKSEFDVNVVLLPAATLRISTSNNFGQDGDKVWLVVENDNEDIFSGKLAIENLYEDLNLSVLANSNVKITYSLIRNDNEIYKKTDNIVLNDFEDKEYKLE